MDFLAYINNLTAADARAGQNNLVKASKATKGYASVSEGLNGNSSEFKIGEIIGLIQETGTISVKATNGKIVKVAYTKVTLQEPYTTTTNELVSYLWFPTADLAFVDDASKPIIPVTFDNTVLVPVYSDSVNGITLRETPSTLGKKIRVVSYGDIVGYTDNQTKPYLTYTFWKIYDQKGVAIGWCAKGKGFSTTTKPQAKALPKFDANGSTEQTYSSISTAQDPQSGNATNGSGTWTIVAWIVGVLLIIWVTPKIVKRVFNRNQDGKSGK